MADTPTILCKPDGPYLVKGLETLRDTNGAALPTQPVVALCRCGGSATKPFCDGTHKKNGFSGARQSGGANDRLDEYRTGGVVIRDNRSICAHAGHCTDGLAAVFRYGQEPWIDPAGAPGEAVMETVRKCPSGALSCSVDGVAQGEPSGAPAIAVSEDGPYAVTGAIELLDAPWAQGASQRRFTLCRCGASKNKPFCDGSHWDAGFKDSAARRS